MNSDMDRRIFALIFLGLFPVAIALKCYHCDEEVRGGYTNGDCNAKWTQDQCRLFDVCIFLNKTVGDTTVIKRGCGATNTCEVQKSHGHYYQFACNTCNTDLCNTGQGVVDSSSGSTTLWWPFNVVSGGSGSSTSYGNSGSSSNSGGSSRGTYSQFKQQAAEYNRIARDIRQKLLEWEHEFDEWHHHFDHRNSRTPPPPIPSFC